MRFSEYQEKALKTSGGKVWLEGDFPEGREMIAALGLAGEAGEICEMVKKMYGHGHQYTRSDFVEELGDLLVTISTSVFACLKRSETGQL